ncbi:MAG: FAD/NAD(P)-binding protein [Proteobacteria bacterium]|nr:FAD/NAD(P)-binding protein [Pseudomonadota bacterium]
MENYFDIIVIGGGFSGVASVYHLAKLSKQKNIKLKVAIIEPNQELGAGVAYSTKSINHILNVRASMMSIDSKDPNSFTTWMQQSDRNFKASFFAPRKVYKKYLQDCLDNVLKTSASTFKLERIQDSAVKIKTVDANSYEIVLNSEQSLFAKKIVLAIGNLPYRPKFFPITDTETIPPPWNIETFPNHTKEVIILGAGLSAIDVMADFERKGYQGHYTIISRHALLCEIHNEPPVPPPAETSRFVKENFLNKNNLLLLLKEFHRALREGHSWRYLIDAIRPDIEIIWSKLPHKDRLRFFRHLRVSWDTHRHRVPLQNWDMVSRLLGENRLSLLRGNIIKIEQSDKFSKVEYGSLKDQKKRSIKGEVIVNCLGLCPQLKFAESTLIHQLFLDNLATTEPLGMGLLTTDDGELINCRQLTTRGIYTLGPLRRGALFETIAVPELKIQAERLAELLTQ